MTLSITMLCYYAECHHAECQYAECHILCAIAMNVVMLSGVVVLSIVILSVIVSCRIFTHLATLFHLAMLKRLRAQTLAPPIPFPL